MHIIKILLICRHTALAALDEALEAKARFEEEVKALKEIAQTIRGSPRRVGQVLCICELVSTLEHRPRPKWSCPRREERL